MTFKKPVVVAVIFLLVLVIIAIITVKFLPRSKADNIRLDSGSITGKTEGETRAYLGIPYAAPPTDDLRWKSPQPVTSWENTRSFTEFGSICPQPTDIDPYAQFTETSEDCLSLNVWAPAASDENWIAQKFKKKLPVMVWIHGGGFMVGASGVDFYNGQNLASQGAVVVTINYRLGPFGFLAHPSLASESENGVAGNYGLLDQIAALKWVQQNIEAFGGDPENVTIFGESAGSIIATTLMLSPEAEGLFQRVIAESGTPLANQFIFPDSPGSMDSALKTGEQLAAKLDCEKNDAGGCLREKTPEEILAAAEMGFGYQASGLQFTPTIDGQIIPDEPAKLYASGNIQDVPLLIGSNANEGTSFVAGATKNDYESWARQVYGDKADELLKLFPTDEKDVTSSFSEVFTTALFAHPAEYVAGSVAVNKSSAYLYKFTREPPTEEGALFGAFHGAEIFYVFGNLDDPGYEKADRQLSQQIMKYWVNFARTGNPNSDGLPNWPKYDQTKKEYLELGDEVGVAIDPYYQEEYEAIGREIIRSTANRGRR